MKELAERFGAPTYVYDFRKIKEQFQKLRKVAPNALIAYAVKANSNLGVLKYLKSLGAGFDIVSGGELFRVRKVGGGEIIFSGVGKSEAELLDAHDVISINVESLDELQLLSELKIKHPISLRINPDIPVDTHPYISTGLRSSKFGIPLDHIEQALSIIKGSSLNLIGLSCHIGSHISDVDTFRSAYTCMRETYETLKTRGFNLSLLDLGGGISVNIDLDSFASMFSKVTRSFDGRIAFEPGKFLVAEAGILLTKVLYRKDNGSHKFAVVDAGMNDLIRPSLYEAVHPIEVIDGEGELEKIDIVGPVCETGCFLGKERLLPRVKRGDLLAIKDAGAYGFSMASNYNSRPRPAEVAILEDGTFKLLREREKPEGLILGERF